MSHISEHIGLAISVFLGSVFRCILGKTLLCGARSYMESTHANGGHVIVEQCGFSRDSGSNVLGLMNLGSYMLLMNQWTSALAN
jgi:hypothetical protein